MLETNQMLLKHAIFFRLKMCCINSDSQLNNYVEDGSSGTFPIEKLSPHCYSVYSLTPPASQKSKINLQTHLKNDGI